jgi:hypothetical protein
MDIFPKSFRRVLRENRSAKLNEPAKPYQRSADSVQCKEIAECQLPILRRRMAYLNPLIEIFKKMLFKTSIISIFSSNLAFFLCHKHLCNKDLRQM